MHNVNTIIRTILRIKKRMYSTVCRDEVLFEARGNRGVITLNRPHAMNVINQDMLIAIIDKLQYWEDRVEMVIVKGCDKGKAFCAGGDLIKLADKGCSKDTTPAITFEKSVRLLINTINDYKKPYLSIIDGITMGAGVGLSIHGKYRIATENTLFAMPEAAIGYFTDVGAGYFFPRMKGYLGHYLALTGKNLKSTDVVHAGIATHFCQSKDVQKLLDNLCNPNIPVELIEKEVLSKFTKDVSQIPFSLDLELKEIDRIFSKPSVEEILDELDKSGSKWALETLKSLKRMAPLSLKLTKRLMEKGKSMSLNDALITEIKVTENLLVVSLDLYEGVRALLIDRDNRPEWNPRKLSDITDEMVDSLFE